MIDVKRIGSETTWGNGTNKKAVLRENIKGMMYNKNMFAGQTGIITGVDYIAGSTFNLFSVSKLLLDKMR